MDLTVDEVAADAGGVLVGASSHRTVRGFAFDSRLLEPGQGFVAVRGNRDGHGFVVDAFGRGAAVALVERVPPGAAGPCVVVPDTVTALGALAARARDRLGSALVVGITGSAGKTAVKDLTSGALGAARAVHASRASFNNELGLPVTLLDAPQGVDAVVLEMGARFPGNVAGLCAIARPTVGVVTHVGLAHAEHLGGPEGIRRVKGELVEAIDRAGLVVLNADDESTPALAARAVAPVLTVGAAVTADVRVRDVRVAADLRVRCRLETPWGELADVMLALRGPHQATNAGMAAAVALHAGVSPEAVRSGLAATTGAPWRLEVATAPSGVVVVNDAYNASPTAMAAALGALAHLRVTGRRIAVIGPMLELGSLSELEHAAVGERAADAGVDVLVGVGEAAEPAVRAAARRGVAVHLAADAEAAARLVAACARRGDAVLVKASRAAGLERVATALLERG